MSSLKFEYSETDSRKELKKLLHENRRYQPEYPGTPGVKFSNHAAMALVSLYEMGASSERLQEFFLNYAKNLESIIPSKGFIDQKNWTLYLGFGLYYSDYREFLSSYRRKLQSIDELISFVFAQVYDGVIGAAFHPLILIGYGIDLEDEDLILDGLAYLCFAYQPLGKSKKEDQNLNSLSELFEVVSQKTVLHPDLWTIRSFRQQVSFFAEKEGDFLAICDRVKISSVDPASFLDNLIDLLNGIYSKTEDFFLLHTITGCRAMKLVIPHLNNAEQIPGVRGFLRAIVTAYVVQRSPPLLAADPSSYPQLKGITWEAILSSTCASSDEHVIKYVYTAWKEYKHKKSPLYHLCAAKKSGLIVEDTQYKGVTPSNVQFVNTARSQASSDEFTEQFSQVLIGVVAVGTAAYLIQRIF